MQSTRYTEDSDLALRLTYNSCFRLPSFEEFIKLSDFKDSMRLPTYQSRQLSRYHPYLPFKLFSILKYEEDRYINTVFDDEHVPLQVPSRVHPILPTPALLPTPISTLTMPNNTPGIISNLSLTPIAIPRSIRDIAEGEDHRERNPIIMHSDTVNHLGGALELASVLTEDLTDEQTSRNGGDLTRGTNEVL